MEDLVKLATKLLIEACEKDLQVRIEVKNDSFIFSSYEDKVGVMQHISLYYPHTDGRDGYISLSIKQKDNSDSGSVHIMLDKVRNIEINSHFGATGFTSIKFDNLVIIIKNK